ncbi:hypothetical protein [Dyadobacter sp. CY326]|uniref:hypothetical protein n=1 Tax=Dyadobacter sp. CY326 TaxID=2907300 RepID=UPI001F278D82|nr:hypothetical protein [Dyadobacter sp. CY326]MCE7068179.1 hypothetical protein [Dyadobacter sp. CY326]
MKTLKTFIMVGLLGVSAAGYAQDIPTTPTSPSTPQTVPTQDPTTTTPASANPTTEKSPDFNSPQSPVRPSNIPSEDTLIKSQRVSEAYVKDAIIPTDKKKDERSRRTNKRSDNEADTTKSAGGSDPNKRP